MLLAFSLVALRLSLSVSILVSFIFSVFPQNKFAFINVAKKFAKIFSSLLSIFWRLIIFFGD